MSYALHAAHSSFTVLDFPAVPRAVAGNTHLVYSILRRKEAFYTLARMRVEPQPPVALPAPQAAAAAAPAVPVAPSPPAASDEGPAPPQPPQPAPGAATGQASANGETAPAAVNAGGPPLATVASELDVSDDVSASGADVHAPSPRAVTGPPDDAKAAPEHAAPTPASADAASAGAPLPQQQAWVPSAEWLASWHPRLMLEPLLRLVNYLAPRMDRFCASRGSSLDDAAVLEFLQKTTVVGVLPVPHAIMMKRYQANEYTHLWFSTFLWGNIFLRNQGRLSGSSELSCATGLTRYCVRVDLVLFDSRTIQLFSIAYVHKTQ